MSFVRVRRNDPATQRLTSLFELRAAQNQQPSGSSSVRQPRAMMDAIDTLPRDIDALRALILAERAAHVAERAAHVAERDKLDRPQRRGWRRSSPRSAALTSAASRSASPTTSWRWRSRTSRPRLGRREAEDEKADRSLKAEAHAKAPRQPQRKPRSSAARGGGDRAREQGLSLLRRRTARHR